jgi:hypothetical protein
MVLNESNCILRNQFVSFFAANIQIKSDNSHHLLLFIKKSLKKLEMFGNDVYLCTDKSRLLPIRTAYPAGR